ncbi:ABC transporter substrate-binding protein [Paenibacillus cremeus]|uniref:Extracellular solute-binding protein n=1 Tax=Paenibacillus cremeus TaxID=2163881 RepID=A0A559K5Y4_9BACL|nr:ABC transporter substrate-binding protein [Paenibacillus cremeus]TVY07551.1 extracellular solute-binding protein [Paenibacillus cremeus]
MSQFKKIATGTVGMTLAASMLLSACTSNKSNSPSDKQYDQKGTASGPVTLSMFMVPSAKIEDLSTNGFTKLLEEKLNVKFKFEVTPEAGANDRKQLLLASGDYPAVLFPSTYGSLTPVEQFKYGKQGVLIPLNDLIDKYGDNIKKAMQVRPSLKQEITTPDGKIYALPSVNECFHCMYPEKLWINAEWLKKLNLKMPTTTDELYTVLKAFKTQDPNGNGKQDEVPLSGAGGAGTEMYKYDVTGFLMNAFIYNNNIDYFYMKNGKVGLSAAQPEWRKGLEYMNKLYKEGLIDPASFTQNQDALSQLGNKAGDNILGSVTTLHIGVAVSNKPGQTRHKEYDTVPPITGPDGYKSAGYYDSVGNGQFAITNKATEEQKIAAIKLANYLYSEEGSVGSEYGPEGTWWRKGEQGEVDEKGRPARRFLKPEALGYQTQNVTWGQIGPLFRPRDLRESWAVPQDPKADNGYEHRLYLETKKYEGNEPKENFPLNLFYDDKDSSEIAQLKPQIVNYVRTNMVQFISGSKKLDDAEWNAYIKGFEGLKLNRYLEINQKAYDSTYKK